MVLQFEALYSTGSFVQYDTSSVSYFVHYSFSISWAHMVNKTFYWGILGSKLREALISLSRNLKSSYNYKTTEELFILLFKPLRTSWQSYFSLSLCCPWQFEHWGSWVALIHVHIILLNLVSTQSCVSAQICLWMSNYYFHDLLDITWSHIFRCGLIVNDYKNKRY